MLIFVKSTFSFKSVKKNKFDLKLKNVFGWKKIKPD